MTEKGGKSLSIVIPAFRASQTIGTTLHSIFRDENDSARIQMEAIVVDDGSPDQKELREVIAQFPGIRLITHERNLGMCAGRNSGIDASRGDFVAILDADDEFIPDWFHVFRAVVREWPPEVNVCFSACRTPDGKSTVSNPDFGGPFYLEDLLNERHSGEYLPIFRGDFIREHHYVDLGFRKSCGIVSYLTMIQKGPFWVTPRVMRIYHDQRPGSVTDSWAEREKAKETAKCYQALFDRFEDVYRERAPRIYRTKKLRLSVYRILGGEKGAWKEWWEAVHWNCLGESAAVFLMLLLGRGFSTWVVSRAKQIGVIRRYG